MLIAGALLQERYRIQKSLSEGGMSVVYLAEDTVLGNRVAVKEMKNPSLPKEHMELLVAQFLKEAQMLAQLEHPGLPRVSNFFRDNDNHYLVMDFIKGETLEDIVEREGPLSEQEASRVICEVCRVLDYLHNGTPPIIFRDLKPSNIMRTSDGRIKLIDFGISKGEEEGTKTRTVIKGAGTPGFAPPEQYGASSNKGTDARSDIYALGATWYAIVTGAVPEEATDRWMNDIPLTLPSAHNPKVSESTESLIVEMMQLKVDNRPSSVQEVLERIQGRPVTQAAVTPSTNHPTLVPATPSKSQPSTGTGSVLMQFPVAEPEAVAKAPATQPDPEPPPQPAHPPSTQPSTLLAPPSPPPDHPQRRPFPTVMAAVVVAMLALGGGGIYHLMASSPKPSPTATTTPSNTPPPASPTAAPASPTAGTPAPSSPTAATATPASPAASSPSAAAAGRSGLDITTTLDGVTILVDGKPRIKTIKGTAAFVDLPAGKYQIKLVKEGYVTLPLGAIVEAGAVCHLGEKSMSLLPGTLVVSVNAPNAELKVDGNKVKGPPFRLTDLPPGKKVHWQVSAVGYVTQSDSVNIKSGSNALSVKLHEVPRPVIHVSHGSGGGGHHGGGGTSGGGGHPIGVQATPK